MKYGAILAALFFSLNLVACGSDDDDDMFGMKQMVDDFEEMGKNNSSDSNKSSGSNSKSSSSSGDSYSSEEEAPEQVSRTFVEYHYDSTRKATIATRKYHDGLIDYDYRTVQVGLQVWLGENVRRSASTERCYNDKEAMCTTYGKLYRSTSGLCPPDFSVPTVDEWNKLLKVAGSTKALMSKTLWEDGNGKDAPGTDAIGFTMLPGGICIGDKCSGLHTQANFFALKGDARGYVTFRPGKDSLEWHTIDEKDSVRVSLRCVQPASEVQKESELNKICKPSSEVYVTEGKKQFKCSVDSAWQQVLDSVPSSCASKDEDKRYLISNSEYLCISGKIRQLTEIEETIGRCQAKNEGDTATFKSTLYACRSGEWTQMKIEEIYGECTSAMDPTKIVLFNTSEYRCKDGAWKYVSRIERLRGFCTSAMEGDTAVVQDTFSTPESLVGPNGVQVVNISHYQTRAYKCTNGDWKQCSTDEDYFGECTAQRQGKVDSFPNFVIPQTSHLRICDNGVWRIPAGIELRQGFCTKDRQDELVKDSSKFYVCTNEAWTEATIDNFPIPCDEAHEDSVYTISSKKIYCDVNQGKWRTPTGIEQSRGLCTKSKEGQTVSSGSKTFYRCTNRSWVTIDSLLFYLGDCSTSKNYRAVKTYNSKDYYCNGEKWVAATVNTVLGTCNSSTTRDTVRYKDSLYLCRSGSWIKATFELIAGYCSVSLNEGKVEYDFFTHTYKTCKYGSIGYGWTASTMHDIDPCDASRYGEVKKMPKDDNREFVCVNEYYVSFEKFETWRRMTNYDSIMGPCSPAAAGEIGEMPGEERKYVCNEGIPKHESSAWISASKMEVLGSCTAANEGKKVNYATQTNICTGGKWTVEQGTVNIGGVAHKTVQFAGLTIMAENIRTPTSSSICYRGNNNLSCEHGLHYTYDDAMSLCPAGWHLLDTSDISRIRSTAHYYSGHLYDVEIFSGDNSAWQAGPDKQRTDVYGIDIYGNGICAANGSCSENQREGYLWLRDMLATDSTKAYVNSYFYDRTSSYTSTMSKNVYLGARCVKDK